MLNELIQWPYAAMAILAGVLVSSWLLVAEIPMFALKFKSFAIKDNKLKYAFILISLLLLGLFGWTGFALVIIVYILLSILNNAQKKK